EPSPGRTKRISCSTFLSASPYPEGISPFRKVWTTKAAHRAAFRSPRKTPVTLDFEWHGHRGRHGHFPGRDGRRREFHHRISHRHRSQRAAHGRVHVLADVNHLS